MINRTLTAIILSLGVLFGMGAKAEIPENAVWIDVRSPAEFSQGHLSNATLIPYDGIEKGIAGLKLAKDTPIYLYCAVGGRAEKAKQRLEAIQYSNVTNVGGLGDARKLIAAEAK